MSYTNVHTSKIYAFVGFVVLIIGLPLGTIDLSFGETPMDTDIVMTIDPNGSPAEKAQALNHIMNVLAAAFVRTEGNVEVVVRDRKELCISAVTDDEGCSSENPSPSRHVMTDVESDNDERIVIHSAPDE